ncbi:hypothetical protein HRM2_14790 [Desulforapulum autotrophicum HRM2]|uniref:Uncharacterized protein n=1 Tax=Desulforapulum autotrophicum (strain ATCC 43914 / DSM 3382 / VKM B-1955 / HRM2) TaxID=177437 RepID=C0Q9M4_DESAH|nr:AAA family ATPase [Desulforapulum autotrophicum]ACN14588.1 hypothetical protein HRM2_14790 [Desulforapulum autotrophicum HRM2]
MGKNKKKNKQKIKNNKESINSSQNESLKSKIIKAMGVNNFLSPDSVFKPGNIDIGLLEKDEDLRPKAEKLLDEIIQFSDDLKQKSEDLDKSKEGIEVLNKSIGQEKEALSTQQKKVEEIEAQVIEKKDQLNLKEAKLTEWEEDLGGREADAKSGFLSEKQKACLEKRDALDLLEKEYKEKFEKERDALFQKEKELDERGLELSQREASAKAGFVDEKRKVLEAFQKQIDDKQEQFGKLKQTMAAEKLKHDEKLSMDKELLLLEINKVRDEHQEKLELERTLVETERCQLEIKQKELERHVNQLEIRKRSQNDWEQSIKDDLQEKSSSQIISLGSQLEQMKNYRSKDQETIQELNRELIQYADLAKSLDGAGIEDVQVKLEENRKEIKKLKAELAAAPRDDLEQENDRLLEQIDDMSEQNTDLKSELWSAKTELDKMNLSVAAKHNLIKEKKVLELHNKILDSAIKELRVQVDDLVEKQQGNNAFPALCGLDKKHGQDGVNLQVVPDLKNFADQIRKGMACIYSDTPLYYRSEDIRLFLGGLAMSNLHILHGMSGTGKTSLAKAFTKVVGGYCTDIAVQAGWRDKDDLLGHFNAFEKKFYEREALQALYRAQLPEFKDKINVILLDEMNLSRPEQYFAEFLSAMEKQPDQREIVLLESEIQNSPRLFEEGRKIKIPENVWFIGTANHDETTNEFADKTYDRAHVMELGRNDGEIGTDDYEQTTYRFSSLTKQFHAAAVKHGNTVNSFFKNFEDSKLADVLEQNFTVRWGNRLREHAKKFIPVVKEAGGSFEEGLDHLLASKVFRDGKVTGRFDTVLKDLDDVEAALIETWTDIGLTHDPVKTLACIEKDRRRMERGA